jgi:hypothetical protein
MAHAAYVMSGQAGALSSPTDGESAPLDIIILREGARQRNIRRSGGASSREDGRNEHGHHQANVAWAQYGCLLSVSQALTRPPYSSCAFGKDSRYCARSCFSGAVSPKVKHWS